MNAHAKKAELYSEYDETSFEAAMGRAVICPALSTASDTLRQVLMAILRSAKTPEDARTGMNAAVAEYRTFAEKTIAMIPLTAFKSDENPNGTEKPDVNKQVAQILTAVKSDFEKEFGEDKKPDADTTDAKKTDADGEKTEAKKDGGDKGASGENENNKQDDGKADNTADAKKSEDGKDGGDKTDDTTSAKKEDKEPPENQNLETVIAAAVAKAMQPMAEQLAAVSKQVETVGSRVEKAETTLKSATIGGRSNEDTVRKTEQPTDESFAFDTAAGRRP